MHELSLAHNLVEIIQQNVESNQLCNVKEIRLKIGEFSGVVVDSLIFSYNIITENTELSKSKLIIEEIPFKLKCNDCGNITANQFGFRECSNCNSFNTEILSGEEMNLSEIILEEN